MRREPAAAAWAQVRVLGLVQPCMATPSHMSAAAAEDGVGNRGVAIGVDGGATKTRCVVVDLADRRVLGTSQGSGSNWCMHMRTPP